MGPRSSLTESHHSFRASTQKSLVSRDDVKIRVSAPVASTRMPTGVPFRCAGGSWSQPLGSSPSESVRLFSPPAVVPLVHLGVGVRGDLERLRVVALLRAGGGHVGED